MAKAALVTGGSSGIGLAIARVLREEGFDLTLSARTPDRLEAAAAELDALAVPANVADADDCERLVAEHIARHERLNVLVNSAGMGIGGPLDQLTVKQIDLQLDVNLRGVAIVTKYALPYLRQVRGLVVNLASIAGLIPASQLPIYGAAKAAVISLTRSVNATYESDGVRACALCPGFVDTPMSEWSDIPRERMIRPEDCAEAVRFLLRLSPYARVPQIVLERLEAGGFGA
jgi:NAD(P)-dependent dehydrogenase (short-subunit alcohol dehydrogenase family)